MSNAAASPFKGSVGFGYRKSCGRKTSKMLIISNIGDQVWLITSRQTEPDLDTHQQSFHLIWQNIQLIDIGVENSINEADAWWLVWVLIWQLDVNFPQATLKWCYTLVRLPSKSLSGIPHTLIGALESHIKFLPVFPNKQNIRVLQQREWTYTKRKSAYCHKHRSVYTSLLLSLTRVTS